MAPVKRANSDPDVLEDVKKAKLDTTVAANEDALTAMPITNKAQPTLLGMPREIRDMIYEYAIAGHEITPETLEGGFWVTASAYNQPCDTFAQWKKLNSLSLVNRQLREETKLLPYSLSVINIVAGYESGDWLKALQEEQRNAIQTVSFGSKPFRQASKGLSGYIKCLHYWADCTPNELFDLDNLTTLIMRDTLPFAQEMRICELAAEMNIKLLRVDEYGVETAEYLPEKTTEESNDE